jgi:hypothetical protein
MIQRWGGDSRFTQVPNDGKSVHNRKHAINCHYGVLGSFTEAQPLSAIDGEISLITMPCEEAHNLRGCFGIILNNENAAKCACHRFLSYFV